MFYVYISNFIDDMMHYFVAYCKHYVEFYWMKQLEAFARGKEELTYSVSMFLLNLNAWEV